MSRQNIDTSGITDTLQSGMGKINDNFTELYSNKQDTSSLGSDVIAEIHSATSKATPVDADEIGAADSAASFALKKLTWANVKTTLKTYFDTLYSAAGAGGTIVRGNALIRGHTNAGTPLSAPPPINVTFSSVPADGTQWTLYVNGSPYDFTWSFTDPSDGSKWIDVSSLSSENDAASAFGSAITSLSIPSSNVPTPIGATVIIENTTSGSSTTLYIDDPGLSASSTGGGNGVDYVAPSGAITEATVISQSGSLNIKPIRVGVYGSVGVNATVQVALKVASSYYPIASDIGALNTSVDIDLGSFYTEWISGRASASLIVRMTSYAPVGGDLTCWAIVEQV